MAVSLLIDAHMSIFLQLTLFKSKHQDNLSQSSPQYDATHLRGRQRAQIFFLQDFLTPVKYALLLNVMNFTGQERKNPVNYQPCKAAGSSCQAQVEQTLQLQQQGLLTLKIGAIVNFRFLPPLWGKVRMGG